MRKTFIFIGIFISIIVVVVALILLIPDWQRMAARQIFGIDREELMLNYKNNEGYCLINRDCVISRGRIGCGTAVNIYHTIGISSLEEIQKNPIMTHVYCPDTPRKAKCENFNCVSN